MHDQAIANLLAAAGEVMSAGLEQLPPEAHQALADRLAAGDTLRCEIDTTAAGEPVVRGLVVGDATTTELFTVKPG